MSRGKKSESSVEEQIETLLLDSKFVDNLGDKLSKAILSTVEKCLENDSVLNKLGNSLASAIQKCVQDNLACILKDVSDVRKDTDVVRKDIHEIRKEVTEARKDIVQVQSETSNITKRLDTLEQGMQKLTYDNLNLLRRVESSDCYSRRDNLVFYGLEPGSFAEAAAGDASPHSGSPDLDNESSLAASNTPAEQTVVSFCRDVLKVDITARDISAAHRLAQHRQIRQPSGAPSTSPIVVRFTNRRVRDAVYMARKGLKNHHTRVYINEHLTKEATSLAQAARRLMKAKKIHSTWTFNGLVFIKLTGPTSTPTRVGKLSDLPA